MDFADVLFQPVLRQMKFKKEKDNKTFTIAYRDIIALLR